LLHILKSLDYIMLFRKLFLPKKEVNLNKAFQLSLANLLLKKQENYGQKLSHNFNLPDQVFMMMLVEEEKVG